jgi:hypothetical protein
MTQPLRPTTSIDDHEKEKHAAEHAEYASSVNGAGAGHELAVVLPESLIGMTEEETETMDKRITRRIDWIIMPVSGLSYSARFPIDFGRTHRHYNRLL